MTLPLRFQSEAESEVEATALWYENRRTGLGSDFIQGLDEALRHIADWPSSGRLVRTSRTELQVRQVPIGRFPYHVVYVEMTDHLRVIAVAHNRRRPGFWKERI